MSPEVLYDTNEMQEIIKLAEKLIQSGATLEQIEYALEFAIE